jgi:hypothetical protein
VIDGILVAPDDVRQGAACDERFEVVTIETQVALDIEAVGPPAGEIVSILVTA